MIRVCPDCGITVATARSIDNQIMVINMIPVPVGNDGDVWIMSGTIDAEPTVAYGLPADDRPQYSVHERHYAR